MQYYKKVTMYILMHQVCTLWLYFMCLCIHLWHVTLLRDRMVLNVSWRNQLLSAGWHH